MDIPGDWHVDKLELENFRGFETLELEFHPSLTVLVGVNGTGKTAILDAIAIMLSTVLKEFDGPTRGFTLSDARKVPFDLASRDSVARMESAYPVSAVITGTLGEMSELWWRRTRQTASGRTSWFGPNSAVADVSRSAWVASNSSDPRAPMLPVIALYGVERLQGVRKATTAIQRSRSGAYESALDGRSDFARLSTYIKALTLAEFAAEKRGEAADAAGSQLEAITTATNSILEGTGWKDPEWSPIVEEIALTHGVLGTLPLSTLSSGIKIAAGLVIDLVSRIARANPHLGAGRLLQDAPGIVLIDELDLHLHPTWQQRILPQLRRTFPRIQFIVTTHSPQVLSTVKAEHIRIIDGDIVRTVDFSEGLRSDIVMDRILNTRPEPHLEVNARLDAYMSMVESGKGRSDQARALRRSLDEDLGGITNVPKLADADAEITFFDLMDE